MWRPTSTTPTPRGGPDLGGLALYVVPEEWRGDSSVAHQHHVAAYGGALRALSSQMQSSVEAVGQLRNDMDVLKQTPTSSTTELPGQAKECIFFCRAFVVSNSFPWVVPASSCGSRQTLRFRVRRALELMVNLEICALNFCFLACHTDVPCRVITVKSG